MNKKFVFMVALFSMIFLIFTETSPLYSTTKSNNSQSYISNEPLEIHNIASTKSETVYAKLHNDGTIDKVSVVNSFLEYELPITDFGLYEKITNLSNDTKPIVEKDCIQFLPIAEETKQTPFFYEGILKNTSLPWNISIAYVLNGKPAEGNTINGKSGDLTINIHIQQNPDSLKYFRERFLLQILVPLSLDNAQNIKAPEASQMIAGSNNNLSFIFLPQENQSFVLNANINDFEMNPITFTALRINPNSVQYQGIGISSVPLLVDGLNEIFNASSSLAEGLEASEDGIETFQKELSSMADHSGSLSQGLQDFESNMLLLSQDLPELSNGSTKINDGIAEIDHGFSSLLSGYIEMEEGLVKALDSKEMLINIASKYYSSNDSDIRTMAFAITGLLNGIEDLHEGIEEANTHYNELSQGIHQISSEYSQIDEGFSEVTYAIPFMLQETQPLFNGIHGFFEGVPLLSEGFQEFHQGFQEIPSGMNQICQGQNQIIDELSVTNSLIEQFSETNEENKQLSFVSPDKNRVDSVQFIMRTKGIHKHIEKEMVVESIIEKSFWQKFRDLFNYHS